MPAATQLPYAGRDVAACLADFGVLQGVSGMIGIRSTSGNRKDAPAYILKASGQGSFGSVQ